MSHFVHAQEITFSYSKYPPYTNIKNEKPIGLFVETINRTAEAAGLTVKWEYMTTFGSANILNKSSRALCDSGRTYTAQRAEKWQFVPYSLAFVPGNTVVAKPSSLRQIRKHKSIKSLIDDNNLFGIVAGGRIYGEAVLKALHDERPWLKSFSINDAALGLMLERDRAHYAIVLDVSWKDAIAANPNLKKLERVKLEGMASAGDLYIACTMNTPKIILKKLRAAMRELGYEIGPEFSEDVSR